MQPLPGQMSPWIRRFHPAPEAPTRLVCFAHAGGSAPFFFPVSRALTPDLDVLAIQYPGRQDRRNEPCLDSIPELADHIARELRAWTDKPLTLFGHSMGASVAFEVARRLPEEATLLGVVASGRSAPSIVRAERVHEGDDEKILEELRNLSGTDAQLLGDEDIVRMILPALRADYKAVETYVCEPVDATIAAPITVMTGDDDPRTSLEQAKAWSRHTDAEFDLKVFPGGHFYLNDNPTAIIAALADQVAAWVGGRVR